MKEALIYVIAIIFVLIFGIGGWYFGRVINYNLSYKSMVQETVREMVKEGSLK